MHATMNSPWYQDPAAFTVDAACRYTSIGRSKMYEYMRSGGLPFQKLGKRRLLLRADLDRLIGLTP
jgi:excisionase family DNA binding protein